MLKYKINKICDKINFSFILLMTFFTSMFGIVGNVYAVEKIEGGDITIESLGTIIKNLQLRFRFLE